MISLDKAGFQQLCSGAQIVRITSAGEPNVFIHQDKNIVIKIFHLKKRFLSFIKNATQLLSRNIVTPKITADYQYQDHQFKRYVLCYQKISGTDIYTLLQQGQHSVLKECIAFWAMLHQQGIFFRGIHLENILKLDEGDFALIDVEDCYFYKNPLRLSIRARNIAHVFKRPTDRKLLPPLNEFMHMYFQAAQFSHFKQTLLTYWVRFLLRDVVA